MSYSGPRKRNGGAKTDTLPIEMEGNKQNWQKNIQKLTGILIFGYNAITCGVLSWALQSGAGERKAQ